MAQHIEESNRIRRHIASDGATRVTQTTERHITERPADYEEEYYDAGDLAPEDAGLNTASGLLALLLLGLAVYLIWAALR